MDYVRPTLCFLFIFLTIFVVSCSHTEETKNLNYFVKQFKEMAQKSSMKKAELENDIKEDDEYPLIDWQADSFDIMEHTFQPKKIKRKKLFHSIAKKDKHLLTKKNSIKISSPTNPSRHGYKKDIQEDVYEKIIADSKDSSPELFIRAKELYKKQQYKKAADLFYSLIKETERNAKRKETSSFEPPHWLLESYVLLTRSWYLDREYVLAKIAAESCTKNYPLSPVTAEILTLQALSCYKIENIYCTQQILENLRNNFIDYVQTSREIQTLLLLLEKKS